MNRRAFQRPDRPSRKAPNPEGVLPSCQKPTMRTGRERTTRSGADRASPRNPGVAFVPQATRGYWWMTPPGSVCRRGGAVGWVRSMGFFRNRVAVHHPSGQGLG